jgi:transcriptional regulator with XRE-family HTH domain
MTDEQFKKKRDKLKKILTDARKAEGMSLKDVAEKLGQSIPTVSDAINKDNISYRKLLEFCEIFDLHLVIKRKN